MIHGHYVTVTKSGGWLSTDRRDRGSNGDAIGSAPIRRW